MKTNADGTMYCEHCNYGRDENYVQLAVEHGQLVVEDHILDDMPDSPTEGQYFVIYRETEPVSD